MKLYLSGAITGTDDYMDRFSMAEKSLEAEHTIINPAKVNAQLPSDTNYEDYMKSLPLDGNYNYYIDGDKLVVYFGLYDIAPYAAGLRHFTIDSSEIKDILKKEIYTIVYKIYYKGRWQKLFTLFLFSLAKNF